MEEMRKGQKAFNELHAENPKIANMIRGTVNDPFYNDKKLDAFYAEVERLKKLGN